MSVKRTLGILLAIVIARAGGIAAEAAAAERTRALIEAAGNARHEVQRVERLRELRSLPDLPGEVGRDLDALLPIAENYAALHRAPTRPGDGVRGAENGYLCFFYPHIRRTKDTPADDYPPRVDATSPLYPIYCLYRGRMLIWYPIQRGSIAQDPALRAPWFDEGRRLLGIARQAFPKNPVIGMYLGAPIPWPKAVAPDPRAPAWANSQRIALEKWADVVEWWIDHRQLPNGEFGGGWGDDVELWRTWPPVLIAFQDPKIEAAQRRISEGVFKMPHMGAGFMSRVFDAEHAAEDSADTITPMMLIQPGDPVWSARARTLAELMREVWSGVNQRGALQFKSSYIGATGVDLERNRASDTVYHFRTMQPTLLYWLRTRDPELTPLLAGWIDTWVQATLREDRGKPAGIPPASLRWPDGAAGGWSDHWTRAGFYDTHLYDFPAAIDEMLPNFLLAHQVTGKASFLEPIAGLARLQERLARGELGPETRYSLAWCVRALSPATAAILPKYRVLTGDSRFDSLIARSANGYAAYRIDGDLARVTAALERTAAAMSHNFEAYTSEVRWTDRIQAFHGKYANLYSERKMPSLSLDTLYLSTSGDLGHPSQFPMNAVRWLTPPRAIAALVTRAAGEGFAAELFHFGRSAREFEAELYQLRPGRYIVELSTIEPGGSLSIQELDVSAGSSRVALQLPAGVLCRIELRRR